MIVRSVLAGALHMVRALAVAAVFSLGLGLLAAPPASAATSVSTYDTGANVYDAPGPLSSRETEAS